MWLIFNEILGDAKFSLHLYELLILQIQIAYPVNQIEKAKCSGKEYSGVRVDLGDMYMHPVFTPST